MLSFFVWVGVSNEQISEFDYYKMFFPFVPESI